MPIPRRPRVSIAPDVSRLFSPFVPGDYWRLFLWLAWFPQALHHWIIQHPQPQHSSTLRAMVGVISVILLLAPAAAFLVWMFLASSIQLLSYELFVLAATAALVALLFVSMLLVWHSISQRPLLLVVAFAGSPLVLAISLPLLLQQKVETIPLIDLVLAQLLLGGSAGFFYSCVAAFYNRGLPYMRIVVWLGGVVSLASMAGQAYLMLSTQSTFASAQSIAIAIFAAGVCCYVGFLAVALRVEDWLRYRFSAMSSSAQIPYVSKVTLLPLSKLQTALERGVSEDWWHALTLAADIWNYTRQRRIVVQVFYHDWLEKKNTPCLSLQVKAMIETKDVSWQPRFFLDGGARTSKQLLTQMKQSVMGAETRDLVLYDQDNAVNAQLASEEYCLEELYKEAGELLQTTVDTSADRDAVSQLTDAIERFLAILHPLALTELPKTKVGERERRTGIWPALNQLMEVLVYIWLARHCQNSQNQATALRTAGKTLDDLEQWIVRATTLSVCEEKILTQIAANWRQDLQSGQPLGPLEFKGCPQMQNEPFIYNEPLWRAHLMRDCDKEREALVKALHSEHMQVCEINGPILCGKTSLLMSTIADSLPDRNIECATVDLKFLNTRAPALKRVAIALFDALSNRYRSTLWTEEKLDSEPLRAVEELIREMCGPEHGKTLIIVLDNAETIDDVLTLHSDLYTFLRFLFHLCESIPNLGIVLICTPDHGHNYENFRSSITRLASPITVTFFDPANNSVIAEFLQHPRDGFCHRFTQKAVEHVAYLTGGQPYLVQLLAAGVLKQFRDNYRYMAGSGPTAGQTTFYDPLFTEVDVEDAAHSSFVMQGLRYYWHRLEQHFADSWGDANRILNEYQSDPNATLRPNTIAARFSKPPVRVHTSYVADLMERLEKQGVLENEQNRGYRLRIKLINYAK